MNQRQTDPSSTYTVSPTPCSVSYPYSVAAPLSPLPGFELYSDSPLGDAPAATSPAPRPPPKTAKITRRNRGPDHIRRPRNPFMIYRTEFYRTKKSSLNFEKDHRHISRIIAFCWNNLSPAEKKPWYDKAAAEKAEHARLYPGYQYTPLTRNEPVRRRKVKRNGKSDIERCAKVAKLLGQGKEGKEIVKAIEGLESELSGDAPPAVNEQKPVGAAPAIRRATHTVSSAKHKGPVFHSPLLPTDPLSSPQPIAPPAFQADVMPSLGSPTSSDSSGSDISAFDVPLMGTYSAPCPYEDSYTLAFGATMDDFASHSLSLSTPHTPYDYHVPHTSHFSDAYTLTPSSADLANFSPMPISATSDAFPDALSPAIYSGGACVSGYLALPTIVEDAPSAWPNDFLTTITPIESLYYPSPTTAPNTLVEDPSLGPYIPFPHYDASNVFPPNPPN